MHPKHMRLLTNSFLHKLKAFDIICFLTELKTLFICSKYSFFPWFVMKFSAVQYLEVKCEGKL